MISLAMVILQVAPAFGQASEIKHWELGQTTSDADLSPDDRLLAVTSESPPAPQKPGGQVVESLELWDYRQHNKVASTKLTTYPVMGQRQNPIRYTAHGSLLVAAEPTRLHVLEAATLKSIRFIEPPLAQDFEIRVMETSPVGNVAIIIASDSRFRYGVLFAYDLDTGRLLFEWKPPGIVARSISWTPDGTQFAVAEKFSCSDAGIVDVFSTTPWTHVQSLTVKKGPALAFSDNRLYLVQSSFCKGSVFKRHLGMEVFDVYGWKRLKTISLPHGDIHDSVSFANGRLLASTGAVTTKYDWSDFVSFAREANVQFTIWKADSMSEVFVSPTLTSQPPWRGAMRLSRTGRMVLINPHRPEVFELP